jgi:hypothetical protein
VTTAPSARPLYDAITALAGTPDDTSGIDQALTVIASLAAARVGPVDYASITARRSGAPTTVALSNQVALAVDEAQYADDAGPCLDALDAGIPVAADIATTMTWPGFRYAATELGLQASLSVPLFAGSGQPIGALNLYAHDGQALAPLSRALLEIFDFHQAGGGQVGQGPDLSGQADAGSSELLTALVEALDVQHRIQVAIGVLMQQLSVTADAAYAALREQAAHTEQTLLQAAAAVVAMLNQ